MSYIRCLSNPESLYVWSDGKDVTISCSVKPPHSSGGLFTIPHAVFEGVCKKWADYSEPARFRGAKVEEIQVHEKTGKLIPDAKPCKRGCTIESKHVWRPCVRCLNKQMQDGGVFKMRLSYKSHFVNLWSVTFEYMISRFRKG